MMGDSVEQGYGLKIDDFSHLDSDFIIANFRFCLSHLKIICTLIWKKIVQRKLMKGTYEKVNLPHRATVHFETGFLLCLYRLSRPRRITPDITTTFCRSHTRVCLTIKHCMIAFHSLALSYFSEPKIWKK
jgi:hypothetical protein